MNTLILFIISIIFKFINSAVDEVLVPSDTLAIKGQYIVTIKDGDETDFRTHLNQIKERTKDESIELIHEYSTKTIKGYSCKLDSKALEKIKKMNEVHSIEADTIVNISAFQTNPPYHLSRLTSGGNFRGNEDYKYDPLGGSGVTAYIIDSGIDIRHQEFGGRARWGINLLSGTPDRDNVGHGTHVAGIIGSETYGVAKGVNLVAIKIFDPSSSSANSDVIAAIDWVLQNHRGGPAIINLSLSSPYSRAVNLAMESAINQGFSIFAAGGNSNANSCNLSPASASGVIAVGATTESDSRASFSNYGECLSIFAPGESIESTWPGGGKKTLSGTSMASPFVAGLGALILNDKNMNPSELSRYITSTALKGVVKDPGPNSPNLLAHYDN